MSNPYTAQFDLVLPTAIVYTFPSLIHGLFNDYAEAVIATATLIGIITKNNKSQTQSTK